jgi:Aspartyl protease/PDZ domain
MIRTWLSVPVIICLVSSALRADTPETITVPFNLLITKHIVIPIKVNGKGPYRVVFDTGAPFNLLGSKIGREAGLIDKNAQIPLLGMLAMGGPATIKSLEVGDLKTENVPAIVMDHPTIQAMSELFGPIDGIVGFPFFSRYRVLIDYRTRTLKLSLSNFRPPDVFKALTDRVMSFAEEDSKPKIISAVGLWGIAVSKKPDDNRAGVDVTQVYAGSAAEKAGIRQGDRLLTIDGRWSDSVIDTYQAASRCKPAKNVILVLERAGTELAIEVTPERGM